MKKKENKTKKSKRPFSSSSYKKNLDNMKLLVSDPRFIEEINEIREHLNIPNKGFIDNEEKIKDWWEDNITKESDKILGSKNFREQVLKIKDKFKSKEIGRSMANLQMNLIYEKVPINFLDQKIKFIIDNFDLPIHYHDYIQNYIISGNVDAPWSNYKIGPYAAWTKVSEAKYIPITIYTKLTDKELNNIKKAIESFGERLPQYKPLKNIDRDLKIEEWYKNKNFYDYATEKIERSINKEAAKEFLGDAKKEKQVYDIKRSLKKLREKRFKN